MAVSALINLKGFFAVCIFNVVIKALIHYTPVFSLWINRINDMVSQQYFQFDFYFLFCIITGMLIKNRYRVIEEIGRGGMGIVYRVEDALKDNMVFALKTIAQDVIQKYPALSLNNFKNEYEIMTRLKHPNLTRVYEFGEDEDNYYIIMEYLEGSLLADQSFCRGEAVDITVQILRVLEYMHSRQIVYGDIKPLNIMLVGDTVKLMDFGLSTLAYEKEDRVKGSPLYMPPEALSACISTSSDIFSLGILFYELCTGETFYDKLKRSFGNLLHLLHTPDAFEKYQTDTLEKIGNKPLQNIIRKMTHYSQDKRYDNCSEIIHDINSELGFEFEYETKSTRQSYVLGNAFTNRNRELKKLKNSISPESKASFIIYSGSSGVGKSRLFSEFRKFCRLNSISFFEAVCMEGDIRKYHSISDLLFQMIPLTPEPLLLRYGRYLKLLQSSNPALSRFTAPEIQDNPALMQDITVQNISSFILEFSKNNNDKLLLYFNDIQWIDYGSLLIIKNLASRSGDSSGLLLYASHNRDKDTDRLNEIFSMQGVVKEELYPFDLDGVMEYIDNVFGAGYIDKSIKEAAGNIKTKVGSSPLFLQELIKSLLEKGIIVKDRKYWILTKPIENEHIPANILDIIQDKLDALFKDENKRKLLQTLSLFRIDLNIDTIKAIINKITDLDAAKLLLELESLEIIETAKIDNAIFYRYTNSLIKDRIKESIENRTEISLFLAGILESLQEDKNMDLTEETAYQYHQGGDIQKAVHYYEICGDNARNNYFNHKAIDYYKTAVNLYDAGPDEKLIKIKLKIARILNLIGRWNDALSLYREALQLSEGISDMELVFDSLSGIGGMYNKLGYNKKALEIMQKALETAEYCGNNRQIARALSFFAVIYSELGNYEKAIQYCNESLDISKKTDDKTGIGHCYNTLGNLYWSTCDYDRSMEYYLKDLQICEDTGNRYSMGGAWCNIGNNYWDLGDYDKTLDAYHKALDICEELGDRHGMAINKGNIGVFYYYTGDYEKALNYYTESLKIYEEISNTRGTIYSYGNIGLIYYQRKEYETALKYLDQSIEISRRMDNPYCLCEQLHNKANLLYDINRSDQAEEINEEAMKTALDVKRKVIIIKCRILKYKINKDEDALLGMLDDEVNEEQTARIYYNLWKITSKVLYREKSRDIYGRMLKNFQKIEYRQRFEELDKNT